MGYTKNRNFHRVPYLQFLRPAQRYDEFKLMTEFKLIMILSSS